MPGACVADTQETNRASGELAKRKMNSEVMQVTWDEGNTEPADNSVTFIYRNKNEENQDFS
jgi:hypothetical protein